MIGTILNKHTRVMDACFRLGGDEFAILMPGTALEGAKILAERFRTQIAEANLCEGTVTASIGVVEAGEETIESLAERADAELGADNSARTLYFVETADRRRWVRIWVRTVFVPAAF